MVCMFLRNKKCFTARDYSLHLVLLLSKMQNIFYIYIPVRLSNCIMRFLKKISRIGIWQEKVAMENFAGAEYTLLLLYDQA